MASVPDPREQEGFSDRFDAYEDPGSASCALEDLLGRASDECRGQDLDDLTWLLDVAHDHFASGAIDEGTAALGVFEARVEDLREAGIMSPGFAGRILSLSEAAIAWAGEAQGSDVFEDTLRFDEPSGDLGYLDV